MKHEEIINTKKLEFKGKENETEKHLKKKMRKNFQHW